MNEHLAWKPAIRGIVTTFAKRSRFAYVDRSAIEILYDSKMLRRPFTTVTLKREDVDELMRQREAARKGTATSSPAGDGNASADSRNHTGNASPVDSPGLGGASLTFTAAGLGRKSKVY